MNVLRTPLNLVIPALALLLALPAVAADPDPKTVLSEAAGVLRQHDSLRVLATLNYRGKFQGTEEAFETDYTIAVRRPGSISIHLSNVDQEMFVYGNGKNFTHYIPYYKQYRVAEQTMGLSDMIAMSGSDMTSPALLGLATLMQPEPFTEAFAPESLKYIGAEDVDGKACDRVRFAANNRSYDFWIESAPARLVRRIESSMEPEESGYQTRYGVPFDFEVIINIKEWDLGSDVTALLAFAAPEGVEKVDMFMPPRQPYPSEALKDKAAPDFTLPLLAGGNVTLSKDKGKVVLLDFWATWCGPCRVSLPVVKQIADEYAGKGVSVYAVNLAEDAETITSYLTEAGLTGLPVAIDADAAVTQQYSPDGAVPVTFLVDKEGTVRIVHVGIKVDPAAMAKATTPEEAEKIQREGYANSLRAEIDALLAGKTPPAE